MKTLVTVPQINTNDDQVEVVAWHVAPGTRVQAGQEIVDVETSKAVVTLNADVDGFVRPLAGTRVLVRVGEPLYLIATAEEELAVGADTTVAPPAGPAPGLDATAEPEFVAGAASARFSAAAARVLRERGLSPEQFRGAGLVTARQLVGDSGSAIIAPGRTVPLVEVPRSPSPAAARTERVPLGKQAEIRSLTRGESGNVNSRLSIHFDSAPIRERLLREQAFDGNIQPLVLFELSRLLRNWPQFTAFYADGAIHYYDRVDIGLAVDLGKGLKVVTLREADRMMPIDFFESTIDIGLRYLENGLRPEELVGSTITLTDLSGFNVLHFQPLINGEQSAIIGIGGDSALPGFPMSINMAFDHRVTNGRDVALFLGELRARLLSYAPVGPSEATTPAEATLPAETAVARPAVCEQCDTCGVRIGEYYREYGRSAYMLAYFREDGSLGGVCHRCQSGWF